ncbi:MAG: alpha-galactosidase, partial [Bacteroidales bacterium]|nr:alpha-galactosidase [Bacteroidales bacterium]
MKKTIISGAMLLATTLPALAWQGDITVETPNTKMLLHAAEGQDLRMAYFGAKTATMQELLDAGNDLNFPALPAFGTVDVIHLPAIQVEHANGDQNLELQVTDYSTADDGFAVIHVFTMTDKLLPVTVKLY